MCGAQPQLLNEKLRVRTLNWAEDRKVVTLAGRLSVSVQQKLVDWQSCPVSLIVAMQFNLNQPFSARHDGKPPDTVATLSTGS